MPTLPSLDQLEAAAATVYRGMAPTPQYRWPLLCARLGAEVWLKHENHSPIGAFKLRGGLVYFDHLCREQPDVAGVITATRGNHGQSIGYAARHYKIPATVIVPHGNSVEKNAAMRALGVELIEHGADYQAASEFADARAVERSLHTIPTFHPYLVAGVASYSLELLRAAPDLDVVYVPMGNCSGVAGMIAARNALGAKARVVGVVSDGAPAYALSLEAGELVSAPATTFIADGMAVRVPNPDSLEIVRTGADHLVRVTDHEVTDAMRALFHDTHNVAEGAGAAALAAAIKEAPQNRGQRIGVILSGGNVDTDVFAKVLRNEL